MHYHPFLPLLDTSRSPDQYYESSPLLFWTIISVASCRYRDDSTLLNPLSRAVISLAWSTISASPLTCLNIQALIILCTWPFYSVNLWKGYMVLFSGIAFNSGMTLGLHRPGNAQDFVHPHAKTTPHITEAEGMARMKTWAACNITAQKFVNPTPAFAWRDVLTISLA